MSACLAGVVLGRSHEGAWGLAGLTGAGDNFTFLQFSYRLLLRHVPAPREETRNPFSCQPLAQTLDRESGPMSLCSWAHLIWPPGEPSLPGNETQNQSKADLEPWEQSHLRLTSLLFLCSVQSHNQAVWLREQPSILISHPWGS